MQIDELLEEITEEVEDALRIIERIEEEGRKEIGIGTVRPVFENILDAVNDCIKRLEEET